MNGIAFDLVSYNEFILEGWNLMWFVRAVVSNFSCFCCCQFTCYCWCFCGFKWSLGILCFNFEKINQFFLKSNIYILRFNSSFPSFSVSSQFFQRNLVGSLRRNSMINNLRRCQNDWNTLLNVVFQNNLDCFDKNKDMT